MATPVLAIAAQDTSGVLKRTMIERRALGPNDVDVKIQYCGVCHSDLHSIRGEWPGKNFYPMVPGHEMVGVVRATGEKVTKFKVGDKVGVGVFVDTCRQCSNCTKNLEQYCKKGMCGSYNCKTNWYGRSGPKTRLLPGFDSEITFGGYSQTIVVDENYVLRIPEGLDLAAAAPLLCAGVTTYSPLVYFGPKDLGAACTTGIIGFGGLGHMAVKIAKAMGNQVVVFSSSPSKKNAVEALGAKFVCSMKPEEMSAMSDSCDFIMDTVSATHDLKPYLEALTVGGMLCILGAPPDPFQLHAMQLIPNRKTVCGSCIGGLQETQDMLNFCAKHKIAADISLIHPKELNHAMNMLSRKAAMTNRFVIDIAAGLVEGNWEVEDDAEINPHEWRTHCEVFPPHARHPAHGTMPGAK